MNIKRKQLSNSSSTGGLGVHFENRVQASFVVLMLSGGFSPCMYRWPIIKIKLQGKYQDYDTDDLIVFCKNPDSGKQAKLLCQIKHSVSITARDKNFQEIIQAAWNDFNNTKIFSKGLDSIALICGPLSKIDTIHVRELIKQAKSAENYNDFSDRVSKAHFTSEEQRTKLEVFETNLKMANNNIELTNEQLWEFLKHFNLMIYDLDIEKGVTYSLLYTLIEQHSCNNSHSLWCEILDHVERVSESAGCITIDSIDEEIRSKFKKVPIETIPDDFVKDTKHVDIINWNDHVSAQELAIATIIGSWNENYIADKIIVSKLAKEEYSLFIFKLRKILMELNSPISFKNGIWKINDRKAMLDLGG